MTQFFFAPMFWGVLIVLFGISLLLKAFGVEWPVMKFVFGVALILIGTRFLVGGSWPWVRTHSAQMILGEGRTKWQANQDRYEAAFAQAEFDLREVPLSPESTVTVTSAFAQTTLRIPKDASVAVEGNIAFGQIALPDGTRSTALGKTLWTSAGRGSPSLRLRIQAAFSEVRIVQD